MLAAQLPTNTAPASGRSFCPHHRTSPFSFHSPASAPPFIAPPSSLTSLTSLTPVPLLTQAGGSRKDVVIEEKRAVVASNEEKFQAQVYKMTTDEDMPEYNGFDFTS